MTVNLKAFRSERIIVTIKVGSRKRKVLQIIFGRDNSLYVNFPYFRHRIGLLASVTMPANRSATTTISLQNWGKLASHPVKYSHHPDGRAHFSQDGKVRSEIRRRSLALDEQEGHMFTVMLQGLTAFDHAEVVNPNPDFKRTTITFAFSVAPEPTAFKLVGHWYPLEKIRCGGSSLRSEVGPILSVAEPAGRMRPAVALANPRESAEHVLLLTCEPISPLGRDAEMLLFMGGFDSRQIATDPAKETGYLAFLYPAADVNTLRQTLGCVDYHPENQ